MTFECTKSKCDEDESTIPNNPITYVLGEKVGHDAELVLLYASLFG